MNRHTNIRYHIYRELYKYRRFQEETSSNGINEIAVPVLSGIVATIAASAITSNYLENPIQRYVLMFLVPIVLYVIILIVTKRLLKFYEYRIKPNIFPLEVSNETEFKQHMEDYAAKFNYEVAYLAESAYKQIHSTYNDNFLLRMNLLDACFCINNALRKTRESLLIADIRIDQEYISNNRIWIVMSMIHRTLLKMDTLQLYPEEVQPLKDFYEDLSKAITKLYDISLPHFPYSIQDEKY